MPVQGIRLIYDSVNFRQAAASALKVLQEIMVQ